MRPNTRQCLLLLEAADILHRAAINRKDHAEDCLELEDSRKATYIEADLRRWVERIQQ